MGCDMQSDVKQHGSCVYLQDARKKFLCQKGHVDWQKVVARWTHLKTIKTCLANKFFTAETLVKAKSLSEQDQQRFLNVMMGGLCNDDSSVGAYATRPQDYDNFGFFFQPLLRAYHNIQGSTKQSHDWNIPVGKYLLTAINSKLDKASMRARVARNVKGWNLPPSMSKDQRIKFQNTMSQVFNKFTIKGHYHSLTPGHPNKISDAQAQKLRNQHYLFNDMTTDNHLTSSGVASHWPHGRGIWLSQDKTKMIWVGQQDQLRIISIVLGNDLGEVDKSLHDLLKQIQSKGISFASHPTYGIVTTCPTNMGTGKRQSILGQFPKISQKGKNQKALKQKAKQFNLQARGVGGQHSNMDQKGTADISPTARFGVTEANITQKLYQGLKKLYQVELS